MKSVRKLTDNWKQTKNLHLGSQKLKLTPNEFASQDILNDDSLIVDDELGKRCNYERNTVTAVSTSCRRTSKRLAQKDSSQEQGTPSHIHRKQLKVQSPESLKPSKLITIGPRQQITQNCKTPNDVLRASSHSSAENSSCSRENLLLSSWGIPTLVLKKYEECGIKNMFEWQVECLSSKQALQGRNLVYSAPTSAGKTLVAELLMLKCVLERKKKALMILPFVSVTHEKINNLRNLFQDAGVRVDGYMGNHSPPGGFAAVDIAVCTIEKANSLINRLIEENELKSLGIIVVDELHMVGDPHRGYLLELLLTKVMYIQIRSSVKPDSLVSISNPIQIVGMSATLPNLDLLASWLNAELYCTNFRPVPLTECLKIGGNLYRAGSMKFLRDLPKAVSVKGDQDHVVQLCLETICDGHGVVVFCPTKAWCEKLAESIARAIYDLGKGDIKDSCSRELMQMYEKIRAALDGGKLGETLQHLRNSPAGLDKSLSQTVAFGVAFHHAGLTFDERDIIEGAFRQGTIKVLTATSTLSSGVNLPARRVIIRTPVFHGGALISVLSYKQMVGRAGRKGLDVEGESILICSENDKTRVCGLMKSELPPVRSCLQLDEHLKLSSSLKRAILEIIVSGVAITTSDVQQYIDRTLLAASITESSHEGKVIDDCLKFLADSEFIKLQTVSKPSCSKVGTCCEFETPVLDRYVPTSLGSAVLASALSPDEGLIVFEELERARRCFVLENELHVIYQVTPIYLSDQWSGIDWLHYWQMWESLSPSYKRVGECVGVEERFLMRASRQGTTFVHSNPRQIRQLGVHLRFYTALALHDLVHEIPLSVVAGKFCCNRGMLQSLQQAAGTFAGMVTIFCHKLGWINLELLLAHFQNRLHFGIQQELCDLVRISCLNGQIARTLYDAGYKTVASVANATIPNVEKVLRHAGPFESNKAKAGETTKEAMQRVESRAVWLPGKKNITEYEAAKVIIDDAREIVREEFGVRNIDWKGVMPSSENNLNDDNFETVVDSRTSLEIEKVTRHDGIVIDNVNNQTRDSCYQTVDNFQECLQTASSPKTSPFGNNAARTVTEDESEEDPVTALSQGHITTSPERNPAELLTPLMYQEPVMDLKNVEKTASTVTKVDFETQNSLFDDELMLNTQVLHNLDKTTEQCNIDKGELTQSPAPISLHFDENRDIGTYDNQHYDLDADSFSETKKLHLSELSEIDDSDCTPNLIENDKEEDLDQITTPIDKSPNAPQLSRDHPCKDDDAFIDDSLFDCVEAISDKEIGDGPNVKGDEVKNEVFVRCVDDVDIANIDGFSEDIFVDATCSQPVSKPEVVKSSSESFTLKDSSLVDGELDVAVIFETQDMFADELDLPVSKPVPKASKAPLHKTSFESVQRNPDMVAEELDLPVSIAPFAGLAKVPLPKTSVESVQRKPDVVAEELDLPVSKALLAGSVNAPLPTTSIESMLCKQENEARVDVLDVQHDSQFIPPTPTKPTMKLFGLVRRSMDRSKSVSSRLFEKSDCGIPVNDSAQKGVPFTAIKQETKHSITINNDVTVKIIRLSLQSEAKTMNVFSDKTELDKFMQNWSMKSRFAFAFAGEKRLSDIPISSVIGHNILKGRHTQHKVNTSLTKLPVVRAYDEDVSVVGMAVCWDSTPYYIDFIPIDNCSERTATTELKQFLVKLSKLFSRDQLATIVSYDLKDQLRVMYHVCGVLPSSILCQDPRVASWLFDPEFGKLTMYELVEKYLPHRLCILKDFTANVHQGGLALHVLGQKSACRRATAEAVLALELMDQLAGKLQAASLMDAFNDIEMASLLPLVKLELNGLGVCDKVLEENRVILDTKLVELESYAFALAGHAFPLASSKEVAKVLYSELKLSAPNVIPETDEEHSPLPVRSRRVRGSSTSMLKKLRPRGQSFVGRTNKSNLQKFGNSHDLPKVILEWRQINSSLNKIVIPMLKQKRYENQLKMYRLYSAYSTFTATGRVASADPSVQMVPRNFFVNSPTEPVELCLRNSFIASQDSLLVAADYSQLELRVLAHLSSDEDLIVALNNETDVFKSIAAKWKGCRIEDVTDDVRQQAKQICYGMIYGIGAKSLASNLLVDEEAASAFIESFKTKYPGIQKFILSTIEKCKKLGYVETMMGRRRYLPAICSRNLQAQKHAERQAVNTTIQGSAADIVKRAMIGIDKQLEEEFPQTKKPLCRESCFDYCAIPNAPILPNGGFFVLQLHDELVYETLEEDAVQVAQIVKMNMESTTHLSVKLTVKVKFGPSWGTLKEVDI